VGVVIFRDEEGVRFNTGLFGSSVFAGLCSPGDLDVTDADGVRLGDLVPDPAGCVDYTPPVRPAAFLECHIEQGMRLLESRKRIGVVTGLVGIRRFELRGIGQANHAGTTSMRRRIDALTPVAGIVHRLPSLVADREDAVITCGRLRVEPGAANIVPGSVTAIVEIRAPDGATLDVVEARLRDLVSDIAPPIAGGRVAEVELGPVAAVPPVPTDPSLVARLTELLTGAGVSHDLLPSMAGHDTQHAALRCPAAMFFIPSIDGISHNPQENSSDEDIALAMRKHSSS
jgi:hydantoinase/carbamoylase family amidase